MIRLVSQTGRVRRMTRILCMEHHPTNGKTRNKNLIKFQVISQQQSSHNQQWKHQTPIVSRLYSSSSSKHKTEEATTKTRTIEEQYSRKTPIEHILLRPGMYIGPVEKCAPVSCWVPHPIPPAPSLPVSFSSFTDGANNPLMIPSEAESSPPLSTKDDLKTTRIIPQKVAFFPALVKIFDEILVNAFDNRLRHISKKNQFTTTRIDVIIDCGSPKKEPFISIQNNGKGIPIQIHKEEKIYLAEMLFGHLLTGSNFDDDAQKKVTGGRHGYGAKLTNIFSKAFQIETLDSVRKKQYSQMWQDNMNRMYDPEITKLKTTKEDFTRVSFVPDLEKLSKDDVDGNILQQHNNIIPPEDYAIMCRRVFDVAGCSDGKITVTLNGQIVPVGNFEDYANLYRGGSSAAAPSMCFQRLNARWEIGIGLSSSGSFESVSFVNGMATSRGGTHVNAIVQQVTKRLADKIVKEYPELAQTVTQNLVRRHLCIFVNALIENPTFDSQMKEYLTSSPSNFGSRYTLSTKFLNDLMKDKLERDGPGIIEQVVQSARGRQQASLLKEVGGRKKTRRQLLSIPKLDDAHFAGSERNQECTLILTEGDSAKAFAVAGMEVVGRELFGVFPLRGKFLNVRDATLSQLTNNKEVKAVCSILGLDFDEVYETKEQRAKLRYGHIMLMTDQDTDGSHIKGLVINFFRHFWPSLLRPGIDCSDEKPFFSSFATPLLKATKKGRRKDIKTFYSLPNYNSWRQSLSDSEVRGWEMKYYKGLGTSTRAEAIEYFKVFGNHHRPFQWKSEKDGQLVDMVFDKTRVNDRREWLNGYNETTTLHDINVEKSISFEDFINNEMIHFSNADNIRSLPSVVDGLKPSQRKVVFACFKRNLKKEIKVAQLAGYCAEHTAYHHGEASLHATITGMAMDFVGSNNINLLVPSGQFGTRLSGGKDAASPRYIFTKLSPVTRLLFPEVDDSLLTHLEDDGVSIEPKFFCPILPLMLLNGSHGIGTGWSTSIPPHSPKDVLEYVRAKLDGRDLPMIRPWVRGFSGVLRRKDDGTGYTSIGKVKKISKTSVLISELPVGRWTNDYKMYLVKMQSKGEIQSFIENHTTSTVSFTVMMKSVQLLRMQKSGLEKVFNLESNLLITNMHAFDRRNDIVKYDSPEDIADAHFTIRLDLYHERKQLLERVKDYSATMMRNKARFIKKVIDGGVDIARGKKTKLDTVHQLKELGFKSRGDLDMILSNDCVVSDETTNQFDYLLNMPLSSLTSENFESLEKEAEKTDKELLIVKNATPSTLWQADLKKLEPFLNKIE